MPWMSSWPRGWSPRPARRGSAWSAQTGCCSRSPSWCWRASSATISATGTATRPAATAAPPPGGTRAKTVLTEIGPVQLEVPRDRDSTFQPKIVRKRQRRLGGVEDLVVSLVAKGLGTGEVQAHLAEISGTQVSRQTISTITDRVLEGLAAWQSRPLDPVYPVIFIDAIHVKLRDGSVANRPIYVALGVTVDGERDILGLWPATAGRAPPSYPRSTGWPACPRTALWSGWWVWPSCAGGWSTTIAN
jgi:hypothetical protein